MRSNIYHRKCSIQMRISANNGAMYVSIKCVIALRIFGMYVCMYECMFREILEIL